MADKKINPSDSKPTVKPDVAKPGSAAPSNTSKQIIINNHPLMRDPMVVADPTTEASGDGEAPAPSSDAPAVSTTHGPKVISPINPGVVAEESAEIEPEAPKTGENLPEAAEEKPAEASAKKAEPEAETATETKAVTGSTDDIKTPAAAAPSDKEDAEREAKLKGLIDSRRYYLPINQAEKRKNRRYLIIGAVCIVLLGLAWLDVSLDAGIITIPGVKAPTHFFSN